jgi:CBS domain-containing protein
MSIGKICLRDVDIAEATETVFDAARRMRERRVGTLVILGASEEPIGLVTDRDLMVRVLAAGRDPRATRVGEVMTRDPKVVREDTPIEAGLAFMVGGAFRRLPVVNTEGRLVGIVTLDDVLVLLAEEFGSIGRLLEREAPHAAPNEGSRCAGA